MEGSRRRKQMKRRIQRTKDPMNSSSVWVSGACSNLGLAALARSTRGPCEH